MNEKVYRSQLTTFGQENGIIEQFIPGFESIEYNRARFGIDFDGHPGLDLIVENMNTKSSSLDLWMDKGDCFADGMLWDKMDCVDYNKMSKSALVLVINETNAKFKNMKERFEVLEQKCELLATENAEYQQEIEAFKETRTALKRRVRVLQDMVDADTRRRLCE